MAKEVWEEIQAAEAEARRIIADAKLKSNNVIRDARQKALDMIALAEQKARDEGERLLAEQSVSAAADQKARLEAIAAEIRQLSTKGKRRLSGAAKMIVEKVVN
jgi:V/A-type H+-transporting ATPase subunit G/H